MEPNMHPKRQLFLRIFSYSIAIVAIVVLTAVLLLFLIGYRFTGTDTGFQQGGLVQFISRPGNARITIGSAALSRTTQTKITVLPGNYLVKMEKDNYQTWQKNITVRAGEVLWLDSARLIPRELTSESMATYQKIDSALANRYSGEYAIMASKKDPTIAVYDIDQDSLKTQNITLPDTSYTRANSHTFSLEEWSQDGKYIAMLHTFGKQQEVVIVDANNPEDTIILPQSKGMKAKDLVFDPYDNNRVYVLFDNGQLRKYLLSEVKENTVIGSSVQNFTPFDGGVMFVESNKTTSQIRYESDSSTVSRLLKKVPKETNVHALLARYNRGWYVVMSDSKGITIYKTDQLTSSDDTTSQKLVEFEQIPMKQAQQQLFMRKGDQILMAIQGRTVTSYNFETDHATNFTLPYSVSKTDTEQNWIDSYHFLISHQGKLALYEYDGSNLFDIAQATGNYPSVMTANEKYIYNVSKKDDQLVLQRTKIQL